ncbi:MAG: PEP-CTERM sorting domain-containing protein, partial [Acidobacteria bacterium]|nr:PEP-CTERM sorting domain-containing protein [Acidobacteriota bacterium]
RAAAIGADAEGAERGAFMSSVVSQVRMAIGKQLAIGVFIGLLCAMTASATYIDYGIPGGNPGTIDYSIAGGTLVGANIGVNTLIGLDTPANDHVSRTCVNCKLSFETGNFAGAGSVGGLSALLFAPGGFIKLIGSVDLNNNFIIDGADPDNVNLLDGEFTQDVAVVALGGGGFRVLIGQFQDTQNAAISGFYGMPTGQKYTGNINLSFISNPPALNKTFSTNTMGSGDILNTVPEPSSMLLMGLGLVALGYRRFRRA